MAVEGDTQAEARRIFFQEALDLLENMQEEVLGLSDYPSSATIDMLIRAAHDLKGGSGYLNLPDIETLARRFKDIFQSLRQQSAVIDAELVNLLLEAIVCLQQSLSAQIGMGHYDGSGILADVLPIFIQMEVKLDPSLPGGGNRPALIEPSANGSELTVASEVLQRLESIEAVLSHFQINQLPAELGVQANALIRLGERWGLVEVIAIGQTMLAGLKTDPFSARTIGKIALAGFRAAQTNIFKEHAKGIAVKHAQLSDQGIVELPFNPQDSLANAASQLSGNSVAERSLKTTQFFIWMAGSIVFFLPYTRIEENLTPKADQIIQSRNQRFVHWRDQMLPLYGLSGLLQPKLAATVPSGKMEHGAILILVVRHGRRLIALESIISRLITDSELVIQAQNRTSASPEYLSGYTRQGKDDLCSVIDLTILLDQVISLPPNTASFDDSLLNSPNTKLGGRLAPRIFEQN
ncbi:MAG: Hpt domain-containing protein [Leptolyngbyaceae cyanobacterium MO_188.B28]|nr:Hpt domain-containing protein [Leptolyngbyaceae cyanobacterium MO_188.B28]